MFPDVSGIIATDVHGNIAYGRLPIGKGYKGELGELDRQILLSYIAKIKENDLIVVGENTFQSMKHLFRCGRVMRSDEKGTGVSSATYVNADRDEFQPFNNTSSVNSRTSLYTRAMTYALTHRCDTIHVMGGVSVYQAFKKHYNRLIHCTFKIPCPSQDKCHKPMEVYVGDIVDPNVEDALLFGSIPSAVYIDNEAFRVVEYNLHLP